jgi:hypothetical protein
MMPLHWLRTGMGLDRAVGKRLVAWVVACGCGAAVTSCGGMTDVYTGTQHLQIPAIGAGGTWTGWSETTFEESIPQGKSVHLLGVTLTSSTGDFSWLASASGSTPSGQPIASLGSMESITGPAYMNVEYDGNLVPLMVDPNTIRMNWSEQFAPTLAQSYPDGITVTVTYSIELQ